MSRKLFTPSFRSYKEMVLFIFGCTCEQDFFRSLYYVGILNGKITLLTSTKLTLHVVTF